MPSWSKWQSKKGAAFLGVLLIFVVITVLSFAFFSVSLFEGRVAIRSEKDTQAHYHAQTGALAAANYLIANRETSAVKSLYAAGTNQTLFDDAMGEGDVFVEVNGLDADSLRVNSIWNAVIGGTTYQETVSLVLQKGIPPFNVGKYGIQSKSTANANGTAYTADTNIAAWDGGTMSVEEPFTFYDQDDLGDYDEYMASFPGIKDWPDPYDGPTTGGISGVSHVVDSEIDDHLLIEGNVSLQGNNASLKFVTEQPMYIKVDGNFSLKGQGNQAASLILEGTGPIHILVMGTLTLGGNAVNELGEDISPENFIFYVPNGNTVELFGNSRLSATIVAPDSHMTTNGNPDFEGISFVNSFNGSGSFTYTQNPLPEGFFDGGFFDWPLQITAYTR